LYFVRPSRGSWAEEDLVHATDHSPGTPALPQFDSHSSFLGVDSAFGAEPCCSQQAVLEYLHAGEDAATYLRVERVCREMSVADKRWMVNYCD